MNEILKNKNLTAELFKSNFGIEVEQHRFNIKTHALSHYVHDPSLSEGNYSQNFHTDFAPCMEEISTNPEPSVQAALAKLNEYQTRLYRYLKPNETLWPVSMPPRVSQTDLSFLTCAITGYKHYLLKKYGIYRQLMAGVHINFSFSKQLVNQLTNSPAEINEFYFGILQQILSYQWLLTYLFGASPIDENHVLPLSHPVRSIRASQYGYSNLTDVHVPYNNASEFLQAIQNNIDTQHIYGMREFYGQVRLKGHDDVDGLINYGAKYLELRMFDLNPFIHAGVNQNELTLVQLIALDQVVNPIKRDDQDIKISMAINNQVALQRPDQPISNTLYQAGMKLIERLDHIIAYAPTKQQAAFNQTLDWCKSALKNPSFTVCGTLMQHAYDDSLMRFGIETSKQNKKYYEKR